MGITLDYKIKTVLSLVAVEELNIVYAKTFLHK